MIDLIARISIHFRHDPFVIWKEIAVALALPLKWETRKIWTDLKVCVLGPEPWDRPELKLHISMLRDSSKHQLD